MMNCEILRFVSNSFFLVPHSLVIFFLFVEAEKELKTESKTQGYF